ncbi:D-alanyl-D-alanine carboxypeptidase family protein [Schnuerera ultunensis]|uniref:serine-type D-Ala-D-Ala carboxypeptidase n=1 Tax=[Clostridium] ultunense Esp TaxID=1288971 RepID=A0A1M4PKQ5_9FIRM|nr:D-alanyl-D-alanine carboxypeptidase family protein [Schnuerera ultunensis]SHD76052.1 putative D-alanyl-D-alanine carboxypeptidase dacF [[Clostridium] ultunense Esp]
MRRLLNGIILSLLFILILNSTALATVGIENEVTAYLLGDYETGEILEEYNIYKPIEIASISKLMSYLVVMKQVERGFISLDDKVYIDEDVIQIKGSSLKLEEGEIFTVKELLEAALVVSANDATYALAKYVAGTEKDFVKLMREEAKAIGLESAFYINSTGLPEGELQNKMSTEDIFKLSRYIINEYPEVLFLTTIPYIELDNREYKEENTNPLLKEIKGIDGLKTGFTNKAGYCLVSTINIDGDYIETENLRLISIVMGTKSEEKRKELSKKLVQYGLNNYSKRILANENIPVDIVYMPKSKDKEIEIYPSKNFSIILKDGDYIDKDILIDEGLKLPLKSMDKVGKIVLSTEGNILEEIDLIIHKDVKKENLIMRILRNIKEFIVNVFKIDKLTIFRILIKK